MIQIGPILPLLLFNTKRDEVECKYSFSYVMHVASFDILDIIKSNKALGINAIDQAIDILCHFAGHNGREQAHRAGSPAPL